MGGEAATRRQGRLPVLWAALLGREGGEGAEAAARDLKRAPTLRGVSSSMQLVPGVLAGFAMLRRQDLGALARGKPLTDDGGHVGDDALR
jgi:hypothetical protein